MDEQLAGNVFCRVVPRYDQLAGSPQIHNAEAIAAVDLASHASTANAHHEAVDVAGLLDEIAAAEARIKAREATVLFHCYANGTKSFRLKGVPGSYDNTVTYGTSVHCLGAIEGVIPRTTLVSPTGNEAAAEATCEAVAEANGDIMVEVERWSVMSLSYNAPFNWWLCTTELGGPV